MSAKYWRKVLLPVIERYRHLDIPKFFHGDTAFAIPALYRVLEKAGYRYVVRLKANAVLEREISHLLTRHDGIFTALLLQLSEQEQTTLQNSVSVIRTGIDSFLS
ncbi:transposase [Gimesia algae]|uniref:Transposase DDE domain-containing protein n=1 Tax=Gimesia algae TaxID=2527971 RepID=A0A517VKT2_9PLAN|nr:transposase [Gimesia algae]QDT93629.1 hypothetical protein Pan161_53110 [Gimesia algae]